MAPRAVDEATSKLDSSQDGRQAHSGTVFSFLCQRRRWGFQAPKVMGLFPRAAVGERAHCTFSPWFMTRSSSSAVESRQMEHFHIYGSSLCWAQRHLDEKSNHSFSRGSTSGGPGPYPSVPYYCQATPESTAGMELGSVTILSSKKH